MATGNTVGDIVTLMDRVLRDQKNAPVMLQDAFAETVLKCVERCPWQTVAKIRDAVAVDFGYCAGYLPIEYGNRVLEILDIKHPYFGSVIPQSADAAFKLGQQVFERQRELQLAAERKAKRAAARAKGIDLPDVEDVVSSDDAEALLDKLIKTKDSAEAHKIREMEIIKLKEDTKRLSMMVKESPMPSLKDLLKTTINKK